VKLRRDTIAAIFLLVVFAAYGQQALQIEMFPGQEFEPFKPRTMPVALAVSGILLCIIHMLQTFREKSQEIVPWPGYDWRRAGILCAVMLGYGYAFTPLGFIVATILFLLAGFLTLGERRLPVLLLLPVFFTFGFWAVMTQLLGMYLAPGNWWPGGSS
jgi:putative tricarboxylic transport membrane protein